MTLLRAFPLACALAIAGTACSDNNGGLSDAQSADAQNGDAPPNADTATTDTGDAGTAETDGDLTDTGTTDTGTTDTGATDTGPTPDAGTFLVSGRITYDWVEAKDDITEGGARLDYSAIQERPVRRVVVQAAAVVSGLALAETITDDLGQYSLRVPAGSTIKVRMLAESRATNYAPDGIPPDNCNGASWRVRVLDNTAGFGQYGLTDARELSADAADINLGAAIVYTTQYINRTSAPYALLDTVLREFELLCGGVADPNLPLLNINWSENNVPFGDDIPSGEIGTSYYDVVGGVSNLYIVGQAEVDTDEFDDHVIAHETGHYLEDRLYRSDSNGGEHVDYDTLDPSTAFSEGFGNAVSGMVFDDTVYVDTSGEHQVGGFAFDVAEPPSGDDRGIYSEWSSQYLLWSLYENRDATPKSGRYDRLHDTLRNHVHMTDAFTCSQTFAAYYNQTYGGDAESLADLWANDLATPYDSLCAGECLRTGDLADLFDVDNDIGRAYAGVSPGSTARLYPQSTGLTYDEEFWRLYRELTNGFNTGDGHEQTVFEFADEPDNKLGAVRWYRYVGTGQRATISILNLGSASCNDDVLDMAAYSAGREIASDYNLDGCPSVSFATTAGTVYTVIVYGLTSELPAWDIRVASPKKGPPVRVSFRREGRTLSIDTIPTAALRSVRIKLRGHPTKTVTRIDPVPGVAITQQLTLHGDETGFAIADLELTTRDGRTYRTSRPYPLSKPRPKLSGELASDGQGGYLHLFSAMQR